MGVTYDPNTSLRAALAQYFQDNGFGADGGYTAAWVDLKLGPIPFPFPNTAMRVRAVRYHDLHHIITGYDTNLLSELEIAAWELGAGCKGYLAAWQINLGGLGGGLLVAPRRMFRAFRRGLHSQSFYDQPYEALLDLSVAEARRAAGVPEEAPPARLGDAVRFALAGATGLVVGTLSFALVTLTLPLAYLAFARKARRERAQAPAQQLAGEARALGDELRPGSV